MSNNEGVINGIQEEIISLCEVRGECDEATNASIEKRIAELQNRIKELQAINVPVDEYFTLWKTGYSFQTALTVIKVGETAKAIKFKVADSAKGYEFFLPKSAVRVDKNSSGILILANWFTVAGFLAFLFDRYGSVYKR